MKILKQKRYIDEDIIDGVSSIYGMANLRYQTTGEPFELWVDELGSDRNNVHHEARFKPKANGIKLEVILRRNGEIEFVDKNPRKIQKFGYAKEVKNFIKRFQKPLFMHWDGEIDIGELTTIITNVVKDNMSVDKAIESVLSRRN